MTPPPAPAATDDPLVFTPVATTTARHDGWTPDRQRAFVAILASHGGVSAAARAVGMTPQTARRLRARPDAESFARAWDAALSEGRLRAQDEAMRRGREGHLVPVTRDGRVVGHRRRLDNRLLFAACYGEPMSRYERLSKDG
ncbi:hypothetical protein M0208_00820 [Sphingomonas sp. SUN019]|uniref:hypothetical protein n=1 Tax=Sphingomonas sp. SUN019 TaxID=2937788 RepID=UPI00216431B5|nr:hypothetical protein [Sphingomonas sp. SUN019]UVO49131.1 hypothetical protein M0208_00820 [Sphingomonas sp. SUN019]